MAIRKLALTNFRGRKARAGLTVAAIAFSVSLVVAVTTGYKSLEGAAFKFLNQYLGSTDVQIMQAEGATGFDESLVAQLRADPDVALAVGRLERGLTLGIPPHRYQIKG